MNLKIMKHLKKMNYMKGMKMKMKKQIEKNQ